MAVAAEDLDRIKSLIEDVEVAMLTSLDNEGLLRARPMGTVQADIAPGVVWFFAKVSAAKTGDILHDRRVGVTYESRSKHAYVSLSGIASVTQDRARIDQLWQSAYETWFPSGKSDPDLVLIAVTIEALEYWDTSSARMVPIWGWAQAKLTGEASDRTGYTRVEFQR